MRSEQCGAVGYRDRKADEVKEPVDHILRPRLPWRDGSEGAITECGYDATKVKTLTRSIPVMASKHRRSTP